MIQTDDIDRQTDDTKRQMIQTDDTDKQYTDRQTIQRGRR